MFLLLLLLLLLEAQSRSSTHRLNLYVCYSAFDDRKEGVDALNFEQ